MRALVRALRPLAAEFAANPRLRGGLWLILCILLLYCILVQSDRLAAAHADHAAELGRLAKAERVLAGEDWPALLEAERAIHQALESKFWRSETEGLAQAQLQDALAGAIQGLDLTRMRIRSGVSQPVAELPGIWRVQTRLDSTYKGGVELELLRALATHPKKIVVDRLDLRRRDRHDSHMVLILSAYFVGVEAGQ